MRELTTVSTQTVKISLVEDGEQEDLVLRIIEGTYGQVVTMMTMMTAVFSFEGMPAMFAFCHDILSVLRIIFCLPLRTGDTCSPSTTIQSQS